MFNTKWFWQLKLDCTLYRYCNRGPFETLPVATYSKHNEHQNNVPLYKILHTPPSSSIVSPPFWKKIKIWDLVCITMVLTLYIIALKLQVLTIQYYNYYILNCEYRMNNISFLKNHTKWVGIQIKVEHLN